MSLPLQILLLGSQDALPSPEAFHIAVDMPPCACDRSTERWHSIVPDHPRGTESSVPRALMVPGREPKQSPAAGTSHSVSSLPGARYVLGGLSQLKSNPPCLQSHGGTALAATITGRPPCLQARPGQLIRQDCRLCQRRAQVGNPLAQEQAGASELDSNACTAACRRIGTRPRSRPSWRPHQK